MTNLRNESIPGIFDDCTEIKPLCPKPISKNDVPPQKTKPKNNNLLAVLLLLFTFDML